jgi:hypothetical protein
VVPGVDLRTSGGLPGVTVGYSDLRVLRPVAARPDLPAERSSSIAFELPFCIRWTDARGDVRRVGLFVDRASPTTSRCSFVHHRYLGIEGHVAPGSSGASAGFGEMSLLVLPADGECAGSLHYRADDLEKCFLELRKERRSDG